MTGGNDGDWGIIYRGWSVVLISLGRMGIRMKEALCIIFMILKITSIEMLLFL
jgi:hypothetical protein